VLKAAKILALILHPFHSLVAQEKASANRQLAVA
jgi:hypothetical protein